VPALVGDVQGLALIKVDSLELMRIWNEMMIREHPQGAGPLAMGVYSRVRDCMGMYGQCAHWDGLRLSG
jgi:hypothetical protein